MKPTINSIKIYLLCPIPDEQKPITEYINLKKYLNQPFLSFFFLLRWKDIEKRLNDPCVIYEEASWYDGQIWDKPFSIIKNDRLLSTQIIQPFLKKMINLFD
jgi:hypothetical protein